MSHEAELVERLSAARNGTLPVSNDEIVDAAVMIMRTYPTARPTVAEAAELARARIGDLAARELNEINREQVAKAVAAHHNREYWRLKDALTLAWLARIDPLSRNRGAEDGEIMDTLDEVVRAINRRAHLVASQIVYAEDFQP